MRKLKIIALSIVFFFVLSSCMSQSAIKKQAEIFTVVTSTYPIYSITGFIMQNSTSTGLANLIENQTSCMHDYSLLPKDMAKIEDSDLFLACADDVSSRIEIPNKAVVSDLEHPWMNFDDAIAMAKSIAHGLAEADWKNKTTYLENADKFTEELVNTKTIMIKKINALAENSVLSLDEAITTFANSIGLGVFENDNHSHEHEATINIARCISLIEANNISIILVSDSESRGLKTLEKELNKKGIKIQILELSTFLSGPGSTDDYFTTLNENFEKIYNELAHR